VYDVTRGGFLPRDVLWSHLTSGLVVFAAVDSVRQVDMQVDDLMKFCFSIGGMSSQVIPDQYVVSLNELEHAQDRLGKQIKRA
jgi:uncharacterized membrane protein